MKGGDKMNPQKLKKLKHQRKKACYQQQAKAKHDETVKKLYDHEFQKDTKKRDFIIGIDSRELNDARIVHEWRLSMLNYLVNNRFEKQHRRVGLQDYQMVEIQGVVSDVIWDQKKDSPRILIDRPHIIGAKSNDNLPWREVDRTFDSHLWIMASDIIGTIDDFPNVFTVTPGDVIQLQGEVKTYRSKQNGFYVYKTGITNVVINACGVFARNYASKKSAGDIHSHFNRHGDWVLKVKNLPHLSEFKKYAKQPAPDIELKYKKSIYPRYYERMQPKERD